MSMNDTAIFTVVATGDELIYQWQRDGSNLMDTSGMLEGVTTAMLMVLNVQGEDEGSYRCVVTNGAGDSVTSDDAILTVGKLCHDWI